MELLHVDSSAGLVRFAVESGLLGDRWSHGHPLAWPKRQASAGRPPNDGGVL